MTELAILRHLATRSFASAAEIGPACAMAPGEVRARLVMLESQRYVTGRQDKTDGKPRRVYFLTSEGLRRAGIRDAGEAVGSHGILPT